MRKLTDGFPDAERLSKSHKNHNKLIYDHFWILKFFHFSKGNESFFQKRITFKKVEILPRQDQWSTMSALDRFKMMIKYYIAKFRGIRVLVGEIKASILKLWREPREPLEPLINIL